MRVSDLLMMAVMLITASAATSWSEEPLLKLHFSNATPETNQVTVQGAGFGAYPLADVSFGSIPIDNTFEGATDGTGLIITADPGEGVMVFAPKITTTESALVRISVRTDSSHAAVTLATIGDEPDKFISYNTPSNEAYFQGHYMRMVTFCVPPTLGFQSLVQVVNTSQTETLTAYLDNFEAHSIDRFHYFHGEFLNGDETDPPQDQIRLGLDGNPAVVDGSHPAKTFTSGSFSIEMVLIQPKFYMGKYEVTQQQWQSIMGNNPSGFKGANNPVESVTWNDCQAFLGKLNEKFKAQKIGTFRLPTWTEWANACRAGTTTKNYWGDDPNYSEATKYAWYQQNSDLKTHPVGQKLPNQWGLYDMIGNVDEWCQDGVFNFYNVCGGSYLESIVYLNSYIVDRVLGEYPYDMTGFRVVLEQP